MKQKKGIYFGWYIVITSMIITMLTVGLRLGIGPFVKPMMEDLQTSRTTLSFVIAVSMIMYGAGMPLAGYLCQRFNTKFVLLLGLAIITVSIVWTTSTSQLWAFCFAYGILLSLGLAFTSPVAMTPIISKWFIQKRGKALFFLSTGSMAGIAIFNPLSTFFIEWMGWRSTLLFFAVVFLVLVIPAAIWIMKEDVPEMADGMSSSTVQKVQEKEWTWKEAVRSRAYWQVVIGLFACGFSMNLLGSHAVPMLEDHHFDPKTASFGVGLIGLVAIFSTLVLGNISDRFPRKNILFWIYFIRGLGFLGLVVAQQPWQLYLVAATGGLVWSGSVAMSSAIIGDLYGVKLIGVLYGWAYLGHQIGGAISSFLGGWAYETFGSHLYAFGLTTIILIIASVISYRLPAQTRESTIRPPKEGATVGS